MLVQLSEPRLFLEEHDFQDFDCGEVVLNQWLKKRAIKNQRSKASRTFVVLHGQQVVGYYAIASGSLPHEQASSKIRRNMPNPIPAIVLGRLAIDKSMQGRQLGTKLLKDAINRAIRASEQIGASVLMVHALNDSAKQFYLKYGFQVSPVDDLVLMFPLV